jgi:dolichyl-phosphate-mannose-protein mannosyltransferase
MFIHRQVERNEFIVQLGKLLITAAGIFSGYNGTFDFKEIGLDYIQYQVPYLGMRTMVAVTGICLIPVGAFELDSC